MTSSNIITGTSSNSSGSIVINHTNSTASNTFTLQSPYTINTPTRTVNITGGNAAYLTMELPVSKIPRRVFSCGRLLTLGVLGTEAECSYIGKKITFSPGTLDVVVVNNSRTISLEYDDKTYHYIIEPWLTLPNSNYLDVRLISTVNYKQS